MTRCALCGLPCASEFCCAGCRNVYAILLESGVLASGQDFRKSQLFQESLRLGLISRPGGEPPKPAIPAGAEVREMALSLSGMWCASCGWLIKRALAAESGIVSAEVFFASDLLKVKYCPQYIPPDRILRRIAALGYKAGEYSSERERHGAERRDLLLRLGVAAFLWLNVMTFSLVLYVGYFEQISPGARRFVPLVLLALATPAVFYSAWPVLRVAVLGLRNRAVRMETLLALGILAAYGYSAAQAIRGASHVYFDTACAIVTLVLLGKLVEQGAKEHTARAVTLLHRMMPQKARLLVNGRERFVSIGALEPGAVVVIKPGERVPADGVVVEGRSHVDESVLSGESAPVAKGAGDSLICGSVNIGGVLQVLATRVGAESTLAHIIRSVESALQTRSSMERMADRVSRAFVPAVILLAILTFAGWSLTAGARPALLRAITVLVIACPCALGIATPLALTAAIGAASRKGILVRDSRVLEAIRWVDIVILDKTGTVTEGDFGLLAEAGESGLLPLVASLEALSEHPLARALVRRAREQGWPLHPPRDIEVRPGMGISGRVAGLEVFIGNQNMAGSGVFEERARAWERQGNTVAFFGCHGEVRGALAFGDRLRPDAAALVAALRARGIRTLVVSGDAAATTAWVAAQIGADDYRAAALPEEKIRIVRECQERGRVVAMIGDGINDAPALAQADLGIALGSGMDIAMKAAPVVLMNGSLNRVLDAFDLAYATLRVVRQNLLWAFVYNSAGITLAVAGLLNPIMAAGAMVLSSLSVIGNSLRLSRRFSPTS